MGASCVGLALEYQVKAAFLYNFAKFIEWPQSAFEGAGDALRICVVGEDPFDGMLESSVAGKLAKSRPIEVQQYGGGTAPTEVRGCHLLFISDSESRRLREFIAGLEGTHVATVADVTGFARQGGTINFRPEGGKLRIELNTQVARSRGLKVSAQLQQIADLVETE